jgi:hypothetical protein
MLGIPALIHRGYGSVCGMFNAQTLLRQGIKSNGHLVTDFSQADSLLKKIAITTHACTHHLANQ